jgi:hypothetical protein
MTSTLLLTGCPDLLHSHGLSKLKSMITGRTYTRLSTMQHHTLNAPSLLMSTSTVSFALGRHQLEMKLHWRLPKNLTFFTANNCKPTVRHLFYSSMTSQQPSQPPPLANASPTLSSEPSCRVISLLPSAAEVVSLIGGESFLVGRSHEVM